MYTDIMNKTIPAFIFPTRTDRSKLPERLEGENKLAGGNAKEFSLTVTTFAGGGKLGDFRDGEF